MVCSCPLSVFPANRGVLRHDRESTKLGLFNSFQYSLRIVGFCDMDVLKKEAATRVPFSIPCESWGSATRRASRASRTRTRLSVFPANRGVLRRIVWYAMHVTVVSFQYSLRIVGFCDEKRVRDRVSPRDGFQYSLRIVGFCDYSLVEDHAKFQAFPFSIPCESWGSATYTTQSFP